MAPILEVELTDDNALACLARVERALVEEPEGADGHVPPFDLAAAVQGWRSIPDGVPEVFQAGLGRLLGMVDAEAPTGDRGLEAVAVSPEIYRAGVESWTSEGGHVVDAVALLDDGAGPEVVAFNRVVVPGTPAERILLTGTLVDRPHRGQRLGLAVKVAGERKLPRIGLTRDSIRTRTSDANTPMRRLNESLGFRPLFTEAELDGERDRLLDALGR